MTESENVRRLDLISADALFKQPKLTFDLKKGGFDMGIGGLNYADSLFFRDLQVPCMKLIPEDIEAHTMQRLLRMPVISSASPSNVIWSGYDYGELPRDFNSLSYRMQAFGHYFSNNYALKMEDKDAYKQAVGRLKHRLVDEWDQDQSLIIGQGARAGLFQSIMHKPPNVEYVYPMTLARKDTPMPKYL